MQVSDPGRGSGRRTGRALLGRHGPERAAQAGGGGRAEGAANGGGRAPAQGGPANAARPLGHRVRVVTGAGAGRVSCAPGPLYLLPSHISKLYPDTKVTSCMDTVENLIKGLKNYTFSLIIMPKPVEDEKIFSAKLVTEKLNINLSLNHPLANQETISFKEVDGQNFIMYDKVGIWEDIVRKNMPNSRFFTQNDLDAVGEIARSSNFPAFSSNISLNFEPSRLENRINIPFSDSDATITFYLCCLLKSRKKIEKLFHSLDIFSKY